MARQSKWPNEELWQQAVQWRKGGLTYSDISGQLARPDNSKRFGLKEGPSEDTVRREVKRRLSTQAPPPDKKLPDYSSLSDAQIGRHHEVLRAVLDNLQGIDVFSPHSSEIETWWSRPNEPSWPVAKGRVYRDKDDNLSVRLPAEDQLEWEYLQQHLVGDPVWPAVENWKLAMAKDISDRLCLLKTISERITRPTEQGGLGLPISAELGFVPVTQPEVTTYYVFAIYVQLMSRSLGLRHMPKTQEEFGYQEPGYPDVLSLGGKPVIRSPDPVQRSQAIDFLLKAQEGLASLPEAKAAAAAYHEAEAKTSEVKRHLRRILLAPGLPPGSRCEGCRPWIEAFRAQ